MINLNEECSLNIEESLLYILDNYEHTLDKSYIGIYDMMNEQYSYTYKITLSHKNFLERRDIIDNFRRAFDKLDINLGLKFPEDVDNFNIDDVAVSIGKEWFYCFKSFEEAILNKKITSKVNIELRIKP